MANKNENVNRCKQIAKELERYINGEYFRCPECGDVFTWDDVKNGGDEYRCPHCDEVFLESDLEQLGVFDWLDGVLDYEFRIDRFRNLKSATFLVAFGGPTITIDTASKSVELRWWTESASYLISSDAAEALEEAAQEIYECV